MSRIRSGPPPIDTVKHHRDWLALVEVSGPFLSLPVLRQTWPTLDTLANDDREALRRAHGIWRTSPVAGNDEWIGWVLGTFLGWGPELRPVTETDKQLAVEVVEHDVTLAPSFVLVEPGTDDEGELRPDSVRLLGMTCPPGHSPTARVPDSTWAATPADRLAHLCRHHGIELGLVTDGRRWTLVRAPRNKVTTTATFDAIGWAEAADRLVVRAFRSFLGRTRFFGVPVDQQLPALLDASEDAQEDITEALGGQVRQAVELLVAALGRADVREQQAGRPGLRQLDAHDVYRGAVTVMMRIVFVLFAEERRLLPSDNELYARSYSAGRLGAELQERANEGSELELSHSTAAWHRLIALFRAVYEGIDHPRLCMHAHGGSLFDPDEYSWLDPDDFAAIDDQTVLHMLRAVQTVQVGTGRNKETRTLSFRQLDVEQIGYVYEGLLSYDGFRADDVMVGLVGKLGMEEEVRLTELESVPRDELAATLADKYKKSGIGSVAKLTKALTEPDSTTLEQRRKKLLAVTDGDYPLAERLLPFAGIIREDLRELPLVILPGALFVTESPLRRNTGTHYTPRALAEEVVEHALEPLIYHNGPLQTADRSRWVPKNPREILELKVADIAMGSAAFLVAAARYLGDALIEARVRTGEIKALVHDETRSVDAEEDPQVVDARRDVIEHCLYGVDINPMAVEMAKLSLWLVSMDDKRPFTFLDDTLVEGDSLLGITSLEQLEYMHFEPEAEKGKFRWDVDVRGLVAEMSRTRKEILGVDLDLDPLGGLQHKQLLLDRAHEQTRQLSRIADLLTGAALAGGARQSRLPYSYEHDGGAVATPTGRSSYFAEAAALAKGVIDGPGTPEALRRSRRWLATDAPDDGFSRTPLHWPLEFPEVEENGGFNAIVGNPPYLGGSKITPTLGESYRRFLAYTLAPDSHGNCDLVAFFLLQLARLVGAGGQIGLIATNTLAQGDTREVGLDQVVESGWQIRRAIKSRPWPSRSAALEFCATWLSSTPPDSIPVRVLDGVQVAAISTSLDEQIGSGMPPDRLHASSKICFKGSYVAGLGFIVDDAERSEILGSEPWSSDVMLRYVTGQDLNSDPDCRGSRWIINFRDQSLDAASRHPRCLDHVRRRVKPERDLNNRKARRERWWQFGDYAKGMEGAIAGLDRVFALALVSRTVMPVEVPTAQTFSHKLGIFATNDRGMLSVVSSAGHLIWTLRFTSTMKADVNYSPTDVVETFPFPVVDESLRAVGARLVEVRGELMSRRGCGLTSAYGLVFDPSVDALDVRELRGVHRDIDIATVRAYGWDDLVDKLDHGFHPAGRDVRYTIGPWAQREVLDRLLELNHERYAEEVAQGLHDKKKARKPAPKKPEQDGFF